MFTETVMAFQRKRGLAGAILNAICIKMQIALLTLVMAATSLNAQVQSRKDTNLPATFSSPAAPLMSTDNPDQLPDGNDAYRAQMLAWDAVPPSDRFLLQIESNRRLGLPLANIGRISSQFGWRNDPLGLGTRLHAGIDLPGRAGSLVLASGGGVVAFAGWVGGYGNMVIIDHGQNVRTRYGHLMRTLVHTGEQISGGTAIGLLGSTGRSTGNHLHYELRIDGRAVNPLGGNAGIVTEDSIPLLSPAGPEPLASARQQWTSPAADDRLPSAVIR
jgi:murein DD-endopeptidase MepM/ murein hydrolase activator NlpD